MLCGIARTVKAPNRESTELSVIPMRLTPSAIETNDEELYDHSTDPMEYHNLASDPKCQAVLNRLKKSLPTHHEPDSPTNPHNDLKKSRFRK